MCRSEWGGHINFDARSPQALQQLVEANLGDLGLLTCVDGHLDLDVVVWMRAFNCASIVWADRPLAHTIQM